MSRLDLSLREGRVGASDIACLLPCGSPFQTKADLYARLVHGITRPSSALMDMGQAMEGSIFWLGRHAKDAPGWCRRNGVHKQQRSIVHKQLPIVVTPDGWCICADEPGVIECKNVSYYGREFWDDGVPAHYIAQIQAQMLVRRGTHAHVWALFGGTRFEQWRIDADPEWAHGIEYAVWDFFERHVIPRIPPPDAPDDLILTFTKPEGTVVADGAIKEIGDRLSELSATKNNTGSEYDRERGLLMRALADAGASVAIDPEWKAEVGPSRNDPSRLTVTFRRTRRTP